MSWNTQPAWGAGSPVLTPGFFPLNKWPDMSDKIVLTVGLDEHHLQRQGGEAKLDYRFQTLKSSLPTDSKQAMSLLSVHH